MLVDRFELLQQLGAGPDGTAYRARDTAGRAVLVHDLHRARADSRHWQALAKRLRSAALLKSPFAQNVLELQLDEDPPALVQELCDGQKLADRVKCAPLRDPEVMDLGVDLASALIEAHRLGLTHGNLCLDSIRVSEDGSPKLDFTGLLTESPEAESAGGHDRSLSGWRADPHEDIAQLGQVLAEVSVARPTRLGGETNAKGLPEGFTGLLDEMRATDPLRRPTALQLWDRLIAARDSGSLAAATTDTSATGAFESLKNVSVSELSGTAVFDPARRERLGRYRLVKLLGQGGMGAVYQAEDVTDQTTVAIKVLRPEWASRPTALRRFQKEARLLAEVNNPHVTNLLEVNEDGGIHYLVLEFIAGQTVLSLLAEKKQLDEATALAIAADVARALGDAHERGIVHRDVKPDNILLAHSDSTMRSAGEPAPFRIKLSDFGLARHVVETESLQMTQASVVGTPQYMAPEQCIGEAVDPRTDVYALGATLFHLVAGRPPFVTSSVNELFRMHCHEPPPALTKFQPSASEGLCRIVEKALAKSPDDRYQDAGTMLRDLERLLRGEPTQITVHPKLPACEPRHRLEFDFSWELESAPRQLWPHVSNTDRLNRAVGLPAVKFTSEARPEGGVHRFASARMGGLPAAWQEHPFEWVEPRRFGVLREYTRGAFKWFVSIVELVPRPKGGTTLWHRVRIEPRSPLLRPVIAAKVGKDSRKMLERVYRRIDAAVSGNLGRVGSVDPFEEPSTLSPSKRARLDEHLDRLVVHGVDPSVVEDLGEFLARGPAQEVARIRPLVLARRLELEPDQVISACLYGARDGLLVMLWDLLCPVCRIPSGMVDTLRSLREHGRCPACNLDYELDFSNAVEMIFRAAPEIRETELGTYCIGGPAHSPHVVAQVRVAPGERMELELNLPEGSYRIRGPQLPASLEMQIEPGAIAHRHELELSRLKPGVGHLAMRAGRQTLVLSNQFAHELIVRVERTAPREDALTAARASALALFRELFPNEILAPGRLISVASITLLVTDLAGSEQLYEALGDSEAFVKIHEHFRLLEGAVRNAGGALVKTVGEGIVTAFSESAAAVRAALEFHDLLRSADATRDLSVRVAVHRGPVMAATLNEHLDYFGAAVHTANRLLGVAGDGDVIISETVADDPQVASLLHARGFTSELVSHDLHATGDFMLHRIRAAVDDRRGSPELMLRQSNGPS
jgi:serine/threonine protein kinase/class 3 adenylate cyclase